MKVPEKAYYTAHNIILAHAKAYRAYNKSQNGIQVVDGAVKCFNNEKYENSSFHFNLLKHQFYYRECSPMVDFIWRNSYDVLTDKIHTVFYLANT